MSKGAGWKATERRIACQIGGVRNGNRGMATADCENSWLCCEVKHWSTLPVRVVHAMEQAEHADGEGQLPIAILHQNGQRAGRDLVVLRWSSFQDFFGDTKAKGEG